MGLFGMTALEKKQAVVILGSPRSGTTLVQRLLNSYDDVLIWGEHHGVLAPLGEAFFRVMRGRPWEAPFLLRAPKLEWAKTLPEDKANWSTQVWMNWFRESEWKNGFRDFLEGLFLPGGLPGKSFWGFKEVSYGYGDRAMELVREIFPEAWFVFVVRNAFNVLASTKAEYDSAGKPADLEACGQMVERWKWQNQRFWTWHTTNQSRSFWLRYEDLIRGEGGVVHLLGEMGKGFGARQWDLLRAKSGRGSSFGDESFNERWRTLPPDWRLAAAASLGALNRQLGYRERVTRRAVDEEEKCGQERLRPIRHEAGSS